jgi:hypothetical protein
MCCGRKLSSIRRLTKNAKTGLSRMVTIASAVMRFSSDPTCNRDGAPHTDHFSWENASLLGSPCQCWRETMPDFRDNSTTGEPDNVRFG